MDAVAERLEGLSGTRHISLVEAHSGRPSIVTADLRSAAADSALATLTELGVPPEDIALIRLDTIAESGGGEAPALIWADVLGQARVQARAAARYLVLMAAAGVIAALAVMNDSPTLIVGAMAISPDLLPVTAACTGIVLGRPRLVGRGLATLALGLGARCPRAWQDAGGRDARKRCGRRGDLGDDDPGGRVPRRRPRHRGVRPIAVRARSPRCERGDDARRGSMALAVQRGFSRSDE
jgi:hypothetical protein